MNPWWDVMVKQTHSICHLDRYRQVKKLSQSSVPQIFLPAKISTRKNFYCRRFLPAKISTGECFYPQKFLPLPMYVILLTYLTSRWCVAVFSYCRVINGSINIISHWFVFSWTSKDRQYSQHHLGFPTPFLWGKLTLLQYWKELKITADIKKTWQIRQAPFYRLYCSLVSYSAWMIFYGDYCSGVAYQSLLHKGTFFHLT